MPDIVSSQNPARDAYIAGLRQLADWLEQHPDAEIPTTNRLLLPLSINSAVEEFADAHALTVEVDEDGNASTDIKAGPITLHAYGYADFKEHKKRLDEKTARTWADKNGMVITAREGGDES